MYSGGLDSVTMYHYAIKQGLTPILIYVDMFHPYAEQELEAMKNRNVKVIKMDLYPQIEHRLSNQIIPSRNLLLATIGSMFSDRVWIGALDGEQRGKERDKSQRFFYDTTSLLTYLNNFFQELTLVEAPFMNKSKKEVIEWALNNGVDEEELLNSRSCYSNEDTECGKCLTCVKRHMALWLNGIDDGNKEEVTNSDYFEELITEIPKANRLRDYSRFSKKRIKEFNDYLLCRN